MVWVRVHGGKVTGMDSIQKPDWQNTLASLKGLSACLPVSLGKIRIFDEKRIWWGLFGESIPDRAILTTFHPEFFGQFTLPRNTEAEFVSKRSWGSIKSWMAALEDSILTEILTAEHDRLVMWKNSDKQGDLKHLVWAWGGPRWNLLLYDEKFTRLYSYRKPSERFLIEVDRFFHKACGIKSDPNCPHVNVEMAAVDFLTRWHLDFQKSHYKRSRCPHYP